MPSLPAGTGANALTPSGATVALPPWTEKVDYEAEVAFVIGAECKDVPADGALDVIAGAAPCRPVLVTPDEADAPDAIEIGTRLNGEVMQSTSTADLIHSIPALVEYLSQLMTLEPGDEVEVFSAQLGVLETKIA